MIKLNKKLMKHNLIEIRLCNKLLKQNLKMFGC